MARIRTIKPEFWTDETLADCSPTARLLFIATWNIADDHGNLERSSRQLKAQAFPYDTIDCELLVSDLLRVGVLIEYEALDRKYLHIKGFDKHQKIEKKSGPRHPLYDELVIPPRLLPDPSPPSSGSSLGAESKGVEGKGVDQGGRARKAAPAPLVLHESLPVDTWAEWLEKRRAKRWPMDAVTLRKQLSILANFDTGTQRRMIDNSIQSDWQGVFPLKGNGGGSSTKFQRVHSQLEESIAAGEARGESSDLGGI